MSAPRLVAPIFIVGTGRSGSTVLHQTFALHPSLAWLSGLCAYYPHRPYLNRWLLQALDYPFLGNLLRLRFRPHEVYDFWESHFPGFRRPCRDLRAQDVTLYNKKHLPDVLTQFLTGKRNRLLVKITGWPRIGFLREIFPEAKFIHLVRDGRAVAYSFLRVDFWRGWGGPANWRLGSLTPPQQEVWEKHKQSFVALAGLHWRILMEATETAARTLHEDQLLTIKYETMCADPTGEMKKIVDYCGLEWSGPFQQAIEETHFESRNEAWRRELTKEQQEILAEVVGPTLQNYGYA